MLRPPILFVRDLDDVNHNMNPVEYEGPPDSQNFLQAYASWLVRLPGAPRSAPGGPVQGFEMDPSFLEANSLFRLTSFLFGY
jgi:hypothetical protein